MELVTDYNLLVRSKRETARAIHCSVYKLHLVAETAVTIMRTEWAVHWYVALLAQPLTAERSPLSTKSVRKTNIKDKKK